MLTPEETVELGIWCQDLLQHPYFNRLAAEYQNSVAMALLATKPEQKEVREQEYMKLQGAVAFTGFLAAVVKEAHDLTSPVEVVDDSDEPLPDILD